MKLKKTDRLRPWKEKIGIMFLVQEEVQRQDKAHINLYYYPELAAKEKQVVAAEAFLGHPIDKNYRDFLLCANGWKDFGQAVDLFGTNELSGSDLMNTALEMLDKLDAVYPLQKNTGFSKKDLLPIGLSVEDKTLHVLTRPASHHPGVVIWLDSQGEVERYPDFEEYFLTMADYSRCIIEWFKEKIDLLYY